MADAPDREQLVDGIKRFSSVLKRFLSLLLSFGIVLAFVLIGLAIAVYVFDPLLFQAVADSPRDPIADEARVFESTTSAIGCADGRDNATVTTYQFLGAHHLTISGYVTLPNASSVLTEPTIVKRSDDQYVLVVESRPTNGQKQGCQGLAHYTAKIQLPYGTNDYELVVRHGENRTLRITERT
jgi:hypothetical protein